jgi:hypothetical protein
MDCYSLLEKVYRDLKSSAAAYKNYLTNGSNYQSAIEIKKYNSGLRTLLSENREILPDHLKQPALNLIAHYDAWTEKWNEHEQKLHPSATDRFAFENEHRFPGESARLIEDEYLRLSS